MDSSVEKTRDPCCLMKTHFLKPYVTSIDGPAAELPPPRRVSVSSSSDLKVMPLSNSANGFRCPNSNFISWTRKMEALHEPSWRKAGIFEAIKASTYKIHENPSLVQAVVEKWCPETKSFIFPWGEATITLEDVMVLLGFSVLGSPVCASLETSEMRVAVKKLEKARTKILGDRNSGYRVSQLKWTSRFKDRDGDDSLEHEAFLAMWLSHFVFPHKSRSSISRHVLPIAVLLARGERVALAPAVLASLYKDLGRICEVESDHQKFIDMSLLKLVQVWTWERFKNVRPEPGEIPKGEPRIAQWSLRKQRCDSDERFSFGDFVWRPYTKPLHNWNPLRLYVEEAMWVTVDNSLDDEFVAFARCVRSSQLVGIGFVEDYYPNRVAMQFGFSQDLPGLVTRQNNFTEKEAWDDYNKSLGGLKLYMPSRLATGSVTTRYRDWWVKSVSQYLGFEEPHETCTARNRVDDDASPEVVPLSQLLQKMGEGFPEKLKRPRKLRIARHMGSEIKKHKTGDCGGSVSVDVPLGELFHKELSKRTSEDLKNKRCKRAREDDDDENRLDSYDDITISQLVKCRKITRGGTGSLGIRTRDKDDNNDSRICQGDDETVARQEIEPQTEDNDGEQTRSELGEIAVLSPPEARQKCVNVNGRNNPEKKKTVVDDGKEAECLLHEDGEKPSRLATGSVTTRYKTGGCGASVSVEMPLSELFHKELAKRTIEHLKDRRGKRAPEDDDENHMDSCDDITVAQLVKYRKDDGGDASGSDGLRRDKDDNNDLGVCQEFASGSHGLRRDKDDNNDSGVCEEFDSGSHGLRRDKDDNNDSGICQEFASGDDETVVPQKVENRNEDNNGEEIRSEAGENVVMITSVCDISLSPPEAGKTCVDGVDVNESTNPEKKKILVEDVGDTSGSLGIRRRDKEYNNASRICQELASGDDETVAPQEIEPRTEENDEEETRSVAEEITVLIPCVGDTVLPPPETRQTCVDEADVNGSNKPEKKKNTLVIDGTKEAECFLHEDGEKQRINEKEEDERLKQRKFTTDEIALNLEARFMKVEKTLETIRNWITKINHIQTGVST